MKVKDYLEGSEVQIVAGVYLIGIPKLNYAPKDFLAMLKIDQEITVIADKATVDVSHYQKVEGDWKLLTFNVVLPFELVGFLAEISTKLAEKGISIFVLSSYRTDHILIKEEQLTKAIEVLRNLGCLIVEG